MIWRDDADRNAIYDQFIAANGGQWPDMEGLIRDLYVAWLRPGDTALDAGVNHGDHFVKMGRAVAPSGKVIGFEAVPELAARVEQLVSAQFSDISHLFKLHNLAVSNVSGKQEFCYSLLNDSGLSGFADRGLVDESLIRRIEVEVTTIDDHLTADDCRRMQFAKYDIEGAEYHAFLGSGRVFDNCPIITFEWDGTAPKFFHYEGTEIFDFVVGKGYRIFDLFGFGYRNSEEFLNSRPWNFVAIKDNIEPERVLSPATDTLRRDYPTVTVD